MLTDRENPTPHALAQPGSQQESWELLAIEQEEEDIYLRELAGVESLEAATSLQLVVNTTEATISHLGTKLVNLVELNLNNSILESLRDLGTAFKQLQVLWVSRCGLTGLDGVGALPNLRELYASFNDISDLQPLDICYELEVLDIEANCITDADAVHPLGSCTNLQSLTLAGNPVSSKPDYRETLSAILTSLQTLDDVDVRPHRDQGAGRLMHAWEDTSEPAGAQALHLPAPEAPAPAHEDELALVCQGIKHARVGMDSHEFQEVEMSILLMGAGEPGSSTSAPAGSSSCPLLRPTTSASMMPLSASTWIRTVRSTQHGTLASVRASRAASGGELGGSVGSGSSTGPSPAASRPASGTGGRPSSGSSSHAAGAAAGPRPGTTAISWQQRPFTSSSAGARPSTGLSAPPTASAFANGGLYWKKHRLLASASASRTSDLQPADDEEADGSASVLTYGADGTIGGSLARDLRKRRRAATSAAPTGSLLDQASVLHGPAAPKAVSSSGTQRQEAVSARRAVLQRTSYDSAALLEELRRWKLETADRAVQPEDDVGSSETPWADSTGLGPAAEASGAGTAGAGTADIFLVRNSNGEDAPSISSLHVTRPSTAAAGELPPPHPAYPLSPKALAPLSAHAQLQQQAAQQQNQQQQHHQPHLSPLRRSLPAPLITPPPPQQPQQATVELLNAVSKRASCKMVLAKVQRDVSAMAAAGMSRPKAAASSEHTHRHRSGSNTSGSSAAAAAAAASPIPHSKPMRAQQAPPQQPHRPPSVVSLASTGSASYGGEESLSIKSRPGSHEESAHPIISSLGSTGLGAYHVMSVAGEVDMTRVNPQPVAQPGAAEHSSSFDDDDEYLMA